MTWTSIFSPRGGGNKSRRASQQQQQEQQHLMTQDKQQPFSTTTNETKLPSISKKAPPAKMELRIIERIQSEEINCPPLRESPTNWNRNSTLYETNPRRDLGETINRRQMLKSTNSQRLLDTFQKTKSSREVLKQDPSFQSKILEYETIQPIDEIQEAKQKVFSQLDEMRRKSVVTTRNQNSPPDSPASGGSGGGGGSSKCSTRTTTPTTSTSTAVASAVSKGNNCIENSQGGAVVATAVTSNVNTATTAVQSPERRNATTTKKKKPPASSSKRFSQNVSGGSDEVQTFSTGSVVASEFDEGKLYASDIGKESFKVICQARRNLVRQDSYLQEIDGSQSSIKEKLERNRNLLKSYSNQNTPITE